MKMIGMATLGRDAELRYLPDGTAVAQLSLATTYYDKNAENNRATQWVSASMFGKQAEVLAQFLTKGSQHCFCLSDVRLREWEGNGKSGVSLEARVDSVELGRRTANDNQGGGGAPSRAPAPARSPAPAASPKPASGFDDMDDDIPF